MSASPSHPRVKQGCSTQSTAGCFTTTPPLQGRGWGEAQRARGQSEALDGAPACDWWKRLRTPYVEAMARIASRTPCRCASCAPRSFWSPMARRAERPVEGLTIQRAAERYGVSVVTIRSLYVWGVGEHPTRIGRADLFGVWFAERREVESVLGTSPRPAPTLSPYEARAALKRAAAEERLERRRAAA